MQVRKSCSTCKISKKKFFLGDAITTKWQNIRDAFVRSLKKKSGQAVQRKYVYHDQLQFLLKVLNKDETISSISDTEVSSQLPLDYKKQPHRKRKGERMADPIETEIIKKLKESSTPPDEDESFFNSIVPTIRKMSDDEKLEFRMGVLQLIQKIKLKRPITSPSPLHSPNSSSVSEFSVVASPQFNQSAANQPIYQSFYPEESYTLANIGSPEVSQHFQNM